MTFRKELSMLKSAIIKKKNLTKIPDSRTARGTLSNLEIDKSKKERSFLVHESFLDLTDYKDQ